MQFFSLSVWWLGRDVFIIPFTMICAGRQPPTAVTAPTTVIISLFSLMQLWRYLLPDCATIFQGRWSSCIPVSSILQMAWGLFCRQRSNRTCFKTENYLATLCVTMHWYLTAIRMLALATHINHEVATIVNHSQQNIGKSAFVIIEHAAWVWWSVDDHMCPDDGATTCF